jgi:hypothetical protein
VVVHFRVTGYAARWITGEKPTHGERDRISTAIQEARLNGQSIALLTMPGVIFEECRVAGNPATETLAHGAAD